MRIWVGGVIQESNTFSPMRSSMSDFRNHVFLIGEELEASKIANEIRGFYIAAQEEQAAIVPGFFGQAVSSGIFTREALAELKQLLTQQLNGVGPLDGVYFALHGAMVAEGCEDVEGELLGVIRQLIGDRIPIVISLDLHANVTKRMIQLTNGTVGYRTFPHVDFAETGYRAAKLLVSIVKEEVIPHQVLYKLPMIVPAENGQTTRGPLAELWQEAKKGVEQGNSLVTSLFPVQPWLDIDELGFSVVVVGESKLQAQQEAKRLAQLAWYKRNEFDVSLVQVGQIVEMVLQDNGGVPFIVSDSADSPGAGSTGDSNYVLAQLLQLGMQEQFSCLMTMVDEAGVRMAIEAGVGQRTTLSLGYSLNREYGEPIQVSGVVTKIGDGIFRFQGGYAKNTQAHMGRCVVFQIGKISLLITEKATFTGDPAMYRSIGLEPREHQLVIVKSANQFRADYEPISNRIYILDTPGCSTANLRALSFSKLRRPFFPFDDIFISDDKNIISYNSP